MSLDELRSDLKRNLAEAGRTSDSASLRAHAKDTIWPFLEALLDVVEEIDDATAELVDQQESYLQVDTAEIFAALIQSSLDISGELRKRAPGDELLARRISAHEELCRQAVLTLGEITMAPQDEDGNSEDEGNEDETNADPAGETQTGTATEDA